jgi:hypothetical protein
MLARLEHGDEAFAEHIGRAGLDKFGREVDPKLAGVHSSSK